MVTYVWWFSLAVMAQGYPQLLERALCRAVLSSMAGAKGVSAMETREKLLASLVMPGTSSWRHVVLIPWGLCSSSCHQGRQDLCFPCHLEGTLVP